MQRASTFGLDIAKSVLRLGTVSGGVHSKFEIAPVQPEFGSALTGEKTRKSSIGKILELAPKTLPSLILNLSVDPSERPISRHKTRQHRRDERVRINRLSRLTFENVGVGR